MRCLVLLTLLVVVAGCSAQKSAGSRPVQFGGGDGTAARQLDQAQLQGMVMGMADTYLIRTGPISHALEQRVTLTPDERFQVHAFKYSSIMSAFSIATDTSPEAAYLDMLVFIALNHAGVQRANERLLDGRFEPLVTEIGKVETEFWSNAEKILSPEQIEKLREMVDTWLAANPDLHQTSHIRFSDFAYERGKGTSVAGSGLFAQLKSVTQTADDMRLLAERAMWYSQHLPHLIGMQFEFTLYDLALQPEVRRASEILDVAQGVLASPETLQTAALRVEEAPREWLILGFRQAMLTITVFFVGLLAYRWANSKIKEAPANSHDSPP